MTGQSLKGCITSLLLIVLFFSAILSGNWQAALAIAALYIAGIIVYQVMGHTLRGASGGKWDPFEVGPKVSEEDRMLAEFRRSIAEPRLWTCKNCDHVNNPEDEHCDKCQTPKTP